MRHTGKKKSDSDTIFYPTGINIDIYAVKMSVFSFSTLYFSSLATYLFVCLFFSSFETTRV